MNTILTTIQFYWAVRSIQFH